jgi:hypothetical protein
MYHFVKVGFNIISAINTHARHHLVHQFSFFRAFVLALALFFSFVS